MDLILDDGSVTHLKPLDTVVQMGTNHEWVCTDSEPALAVGILWQVPFILVGRSIVHPLFPNLHGPKL